MPMCRRRSLLTSIAILALIFALACAADAVGSDRIRIGLTQFKDVREITVLASSSYRAGPVALTNLEPVTLTAGDKTITFSRPNGKTIDVGALISIVPEDPAATISVDSPGKPSKQYHGAIEVRLKAGRLQLVNDVLIEDYVVGVLAGEMPSGYPMEALKAQAVAARTYTIRCRGKHASAGYDLCDGSHCQVYDGALNETPARRRAVLATAGQILTYNGQLASTMYCADCGGVTECYGPSAPYLASVAEPAGIPHSTWSKTYSLAELSAKLIAAGFKQADGLAKVSVSKTRPSGRAESVLLTSAKGTLTIDATRLRFILGPSVIQSTLFSVQMSSDGTVRFDGRGCGHGIGMCQVGAKALAGPPFNYAFDQILAHYYPGTKLAAGIGAGQPVTTAATVNRNMLRVRVVEPRL